MAQQGEVALRLATAIAEGVGPRPAGSVALEATRDLVEDELTAVGWSTTRWEAERAGGLFACRQGGPDVLLLIAHLDSVHPDCPGANDNAAAVGVLIELAGRVGRTPRTVCLSFPDGEELGMRGTVALMQKGLLPGPIDQVVALDLVGRGTLVHNGLGPGFSSHDARALLDAAPAGVPWVYRALSHGAPHMERSDHVVYTLDGLPASHVMARGESGVFWAYHTSHDTPDVLELDTLGQAVRALEGVALMEPLDGGAGEPWFVVPFTAIVAPGAVTWGLLTLGPLTGLGGVLRGGERTPWLASFAGLAAGTCAFALLGQRPFGLALAGPVVAGVWAAWAAGMLAVGGGNGLGFARVAVGIGTLAVVGLLWVGLPLLAVPAAVSVAGVGLAGSSVRVERAGGVLRVVGAVLASWPALYLVRPDAVRELHFHGLVPADPLVWGVLFVVLALPLTAAIGLGLRRSSPAVAFAVAVLLGSAVVAWTGPIERPPWVRGEALHPVRHVQRSAPLPGPHDALP